MKIQKSRTGAAVATVAVRPPAFGTAPCDDAPPFSVRSCHYGSSNYLNINTVDSSGQEAQKTSGRDRIGRERLNRIGGWSRDEQIYKTSKRGLTDTYG